VFHQVVGIQRGDQRTGGFTQPLQRWLQGGGFGMLVLDLTGVSLRDARRISLASWFRLRNAIEKTPTAFVVAEEQLNAASCSAKQIRCRASNPVSRPGLL